MRRGSSIEVLAAALDATNTCHVDGRGGNSWRWFLRADAPAMSDPTSSTAPGRRFEQLADVVRRLPAGPFTSKQYLDHAIGLNAVAYAGDVEAVIDRLIELGIVRPLEDGDPPTWVVVD
jgi:hypothetical protein